MPEITEDAPSAPITFTPSEVVDPADPNETITVAGEPPEPVEQPDVDPKIAAIRRHNAPLLDRFDATKGVPSFHDLAAALRHMEHTVLLGLGLAQLPPTDEEPRDELADSVANNPIEQARLTAMLNPDLDVPAPGPGAVASPVVEVTAPQSLPTPKGAVAASVPTVGQKIAGAEPMTGNVGNAAPPEKIVVVPKPLNTLPSAEPFVQGDDESPPGYVTSEADKPNLFD